jgi:hypothetical protein
VLVQAPAAGAAGSNFGVGEADGRVVFQPGYGIPPGTTCAETRGDLQGSQARDALIVNTVIKGYHGPMLIDGTTHSDSECGTAGGGELTVVAQSVDPAPHFVDCPNLKGGFTRFVTQVVAVLGGVCTLNSDPNVPVTLTFQGQFLPDAEDVLQGAGETKPIMDATFVGAFTLSPAN